MLKPLRDYVVLEKAKEEEKTKSGIILTEQPKEEPGKGIVVAVGPGKTEWCSHSSGIKGWTKGCI